ncbi:class I SAM-dependent methyltransferase [Candidatus Woesearchaeota archaeon]|nr:class I SAM-dependent methyltransferase [Candidatus Woesearchaeota archaeon]
MSHEANVKRMYGLSNAGWYDPFRRVWTKIVSAKAEEEFLRQVKKMSKPTTQILDLGCGTGINAGRLLEQKIPFQQYTGIDFSEEMLSQARKKYGSQRRIKFNFHDLTKKPLKGNYDVIITTWVLSHITNPSRVVRAYFSHLKKGGSMIIVLLTKPRWYVHWWFYPFVRLFSANYIPKEEIDKMPGEKIKKRYACGIATLLIIRTGGYDERF